MKDCFVVPPRNNDRDFAGSSIRVIKQIHHYKNAFSADNLSRLFGEAIFPAKITSMKDCLHLSIDDNYKSLFFAN